MQPVNLKCNQWMQVKQATSARSCVWKQRHVCIRSHGIQVDIIVPNKTREIYIIYLRDNKICWVLWMTIWS